MQTCRSCDRDVLAANFSFNQRMMGTWRCKVCTGSQRTFVEDGLDTYHSRQFQHLGRNSFETVHIENLAVHKLLTSNQSSKELPSLDWHIANEGLIAFDAEWKPDSPRTDGVHVLQLAFPSMRRVFVVQMGGVGPACLKSLRELFGSSTCKLVGWGVQEDVYRLSQTFDLGLHAEWCERIVDIQCVAGSMMQKEGRDVDASMKPKLQDAVAHILGSSMSKNMSVTCSDWSVARLDVDQVEYAATDAWFTLLLYLKLSERVGKSATCNNVASCNPWWSQCMWQELRYSPSTTPTSPTGEMARSIGSVGIGEADCNQVTKLFCKGSKAEILLRGLEGYNFEQVSKEISIQAGVAFKKMLTFPSVFMAWLIFLFAFLKMLIFPESLRSALVDAVACVAGCCCLYFAGVKPEKNATFRR